MQEAVEIQSKLLVQYKAHEEEVQARIGATEEERTHASTAINQLLRKVIEMNLPGTASFYEEYIRRIRSQLALSTDSQTSEKVKHIFPHKVLLAEIMSIDDYCSYDKRLFSCVSEQFRRNLLLRFLLRLWLNLPRETIHWSDLRKGKVSSWDLCTHFRIGLSAGSLSAQLSWVPFLPSLNIAACSRWYDLELRERV